jgi:hypothetical protein
MSAEEMVTQATPPPQSDESRYPFWDYQDVGVLVGLAIPCLLVAMVVVQGITLLVPAHWERPAAAALAVQFLGYALWFTCLWALFRVRYERTLFDSLLWIRPRRGLAPYILMGLAQAIGIALLGAALQTPDVQMPMRDLLSDRLSMILVGTFAVTMGPVCEELAFNGFLLPVFARTFGAALGVLVTGTIFALLHGFQYAWSPKHLLLIGLAGVLFGTVRTLTGSTAASAALHAGYNLMFFVAYLTQWEDFAS